MRRAGRISEVEWNAPYTLVHSDHRLTNYSGKEFLIILVNRPFLSFPKHPSMATFTYIVGKLMSHLEMACKYHVIFQKGP